MICVVCIIITINLYDSVIITYYYHLFLVVVLVVLVVVVVCSCCCCFCFFSGELSMVGHGSRLIGGGTDRLGHVASQELDCKKFLF